MNSYFQFGAALIASLPIIAIAVIGIYIAIVRRTVHPRPSLLVSLGLLSLLCNVGGSAALRVYAQNFVVTTGNEIAYAHSLALLNSGLYGLQLVGLILITVAVFAGRKIAVGMNA